MNEFLKGTKIGRIGKKNPFSINDIPDLSNKVAIITGATSGLGKETAIALAQKNAIIIVAARSSAVGEPPVQEVLQEIQQKSAANKENIHFIELDLGDLKSVQAFVYQFKRQFNRLDILVNNAGVSLCPFLQSKDGLELHFAVNHLGHFHLTNQLLDILKTSAPARIVFVSSRHHYDSYEEGVRLTEKAVNDSVNYTPSQAYGQSKLCNIYTALELNRRLNEDSLDPPIYVNMAHPGFVNAKGVLRHVKESKGKLAYYLGHIFMDLVALNIRDGALTQIYLASAKEVEDMNIKGQYFGPVAESYAMAPIAHNEELAKKMWHFSEQLIAEKLG